MYFYHFYLVYDSMSRISFNSQHFLDFLSNILFLFYGTTLLIHVLGFKSIQVSLYLHFPYFINGALMTAFWCFQVDDAMDRTRYHKIIWKILAQWILFSFCNRYFLSFVHWEHENLLWLDDENESDRFILIADLRKRCYQIWVLSLPFLSVLIWEVIANWNFRQSVWPGLIWMMIISGFSTGIFRIFLNFLNFQYQCLIWVKKWEKGLVIRRFEKHNSFGIIH